MVTKDVLLKSQASRIMFGTAIASQIDKELTKRNFLKKSKSKNVPKKYMGTALEALCHRSLSLAQLKRMDATKLAHYFTDEKKVIDQLMKVALKAGNFTTRSAVTTIPADEITDGKVKVGYMTFFQIW